MSMIAGTATATTSRPIGGVRCCSYGALAMWLAVIGMAAGRFSFALVDALAFQGQPGPLTALTRHDHQHGRTRSSSIVASAAGRSSLPVAQPLSGNACGGVWRLAAEADANSNSDANSNNEEAQKEPEVTPTKIDSIIRDLHESTLPFRIVVIGNGAILESTSTLGPHMAESTSPKTGERLITLASDDRSFEFHLKPDGIAKVVFAESKKPDSGKTLRIVRMLRDDGGPICSLILADGGEEAISWFKTMTIRYGYEVHSGE